MAAKSVKPRGPMQTNAGEYMEGHGAGDDAKVTVKTSRGTHALVGTMAPLNERAHSVNVKTGSKPPANQF